VTQDEVIIKAIPSSARQRRNPVTFRPSPGKILHTIHPAALGVRIDSAVSRATSSRLITTRWSAS